MNQFEQVLPGIYLLKIPFSGVWTGVILVTGKENCLIDSGARDADVDEYILPALTALGMELNQIQWLLNTHSHGDHVGGHYRLRQLGDFRVASHSSSVPKIEDPVPYAIKTRTAFPAYSPAPQCYLKGIKVDVSLEEGDCVGDRLMVIHTPGHDSDCLCWYDKQTKTIITGDTLQGNGTICQGVGFYKSLPEYLATLDKLRNMDIENIINGHDYDGIGWFAQGKAQATACLDFCRARVIAYDEYIKNAAEAGEKDPAVIAEKLIRDLGCGMPEKLFMALYTVTQHLENQL